MKISTSHFSLGIVLIIAVVSLGYSLRTAARVRELELRVQNAEGALQAGNQPFGRIASLEKRVQQLESAPVKPMFISSAGRPAAVYHPVPGTEKKSDPRPEPLPPFQPGN